MNLEEINNTITELENGDTTFVNCQKLASLYIVRDNYGKGNQPLDKEVREILPAYRHYCEIKGQYQKHLIPQESVQVAMSSVCKEIQDLLFLIYSNSDMEQEREMMLRCVQDTWNSFAEK